MGEVEIIYLKNCIILFGIIVTSVAQGSILLNEDFESLSLISGDPSYTDIIPGWTRDNSKMGSVSSNHAYNGGSVMDISQWIKQQGVQAGRNTTGGLQGNNALIFDPDAWADSASGGTFDSYWSTVIDLTGYDLNTINITFGYEFCPEGAQHGLVEVSFDGGSNWKRLLDLDSSQISTLQGGTKSYTAVKDFTPTSSSMTLRFGLIDAGNNWWFGVDDIQVLATPAGPTITSFTANPTTGNPPLIVDFIAKANDKDGSIASYQWDFGDGNIDTTTIGKTTHTYSNLGKFNTTVIAFDNSGWKSKSSKSILITVHSGPDLVGKIKYYTYDDDTNTIHIDYQVTNNGNISASQFPVTFNLSNNGKKVASTFKNMTIEQLGAGNIESISVDYTFNESVYGKYILILVDPKKNIAEMDESNNGTRIVIQPMATK